MATKLDVYQAIDDERRYQENKWGKLCENSHTVGEWLLILRSELDEACMAWVAHAGDEVALREIVQVAAVAVAALEQHGPVGRESTLERE